MDTELRTAERWYARGTARAKYLRALWRSGQITSDRLQLMAYCGDLEAAEFCPFVEPSYINPRTTPIKRWVRGLSRWPTVRIRAAWAAGMAAVAGQEFLRGVSYDGDGTWHDHRSGELIHICKIHDYCMYTQRPRISLEACERFLEEPSCDHAQRASEVSRIAGGTTIEDAWWRWPAMMPFENEDQHDWMLRDTVESALRKPGVDEPTLRTAIQTALTQVALADSRWELTT